MEEKHIVVDYYDSEPSLRCGLTQADSVTLSPDGRLHEHRGGLIDELGLLQENGLMTIDGDLCPLIQLQTRGGYHPTFLLGHGQEWCAASYYRLEHSDGRLVILAASGVLVAMSDGECWWTRDGVKQARELVFSAVGVRSFVPAVAPLGPRSRTSPLAERV